MSKQTDELEDALTLALGKYIRAVVAESVEQTIKDSGPVETEDEDEKPKRSKDRRREATEKLSKGSKAKAKSDEDEDEEDEAEESDEDDEEDEAEESDEDDEEEESDEPTLQDVKAAVSAALRVADRPEVVALMKKHGKSDNASGIKAERRAAVIEALDALTASAKKGKRS